MTADSKRNTVFKCSSCDKSLHRFSWATYKQTKDDEYQFKCRYCPARYSHNLLISVPLSILFFLIFIKLTSVFGDDSPVLGVFFLVGFYFIMAISPVKRTDRWNLQNDKK